MIDIKIDELTNEELLAVYFELENYINKLDSTMVETKQVENKK